MIAYEVNTGICKIMVLTSNSIYLIGKYTGQTDTFVELKTSLAIRGFHDEAKFEKYVNVPMFRESLNHATTGNS